MTKETITQNDLHKARRHLRDEVRLNGAVEAVYKIAPPGNNFVWLKDQAKIEIFNEDGINLSLGVLNIVTEGQFSKISIFVLLSFQSKMKNVLDN